MSRELAAKLRKNRELKVTVDRFVFTVRRPTDVEAVAMFQRADAFSSIAMQHVIGWEAVTQNDIFSDGGSDLIPFSRDLWEEWCADRPDFWKPIADAALDAYTAHHAEVESAAKK